MKTGWRVAPIKDVAQVNPSRNRSLRELDALTEVTFVPMSAVDEVSGTIARPETRLYADVRKGFTSFCEGDVIFAKITPCMQNGKAAVARALRNGIGFGSTEFHVLRVGDALLPEWLWRFVRQPSFLGEAKRHFRGSAGQQRVPAEFLEAAHIPFPSISEQRRILARTSECLERVDEIRVLRRATRRDSRAIFRSVVSETYSELVKTEKTCPLGEIVVASGGGTPDRRHPEYWTGTIPWVSPKDMKVFEVEDSEEHISVEGLEASAAKLIQPPAVLFVVRGMILTHTLPVAVTRVPLAINQDMKALQVLPKCRAEFLAYMMRGTESDLLRKVEIAGHGTRRLQSRHWMGTLIPMPSIKTQDHTIERLRRAEACAAEVASVVDGADVNTLSAAVLRRAFSGEL